MFKEKEGKEVPEQDRGEGLLGLPWREHVGPWVGDSPKWALSEFQELESIDRDKDVCVHPESNQYFMNIHRLHMCHKSFPA